MSYLNFLPSVDILACYHFPCLRDFCNSFLSLFTNLVCCSQQILRPAKTFLGSPSGSLARNMSTANGLSNASSCQNPDGAQDQEKCHTRISKHNRGWRRIVRNFTPSFVSQSQSHSPSPSQTPHSLIPAGSPYVWAQESSQFSCIISRTTANGFTISPS